MKNINLYIINTPFGYMVSMRKLHIKQGDTSEQYQYNILDKLYDVNCELIRELYCSQGEYETQEFIDLHLGKSVSDNGWGMFTVFLKYKLEWQGKLLVKIDKWYPSSKTCHHCGHINDKLTLSDREWICESCGNIIDRDWNAAENIRDEGINVFVNKVAAA
jgi:transposase